MSAQDQWPETGQIVTSRAGLLACPIDTEFVCLATGAPWTRGRAEWEDERNERRLNALVEQLPVRINYIPIQRWQDIEDPHLRNVEFLRAVLAASFHPVSRGRVEEAALDLLDDFAEFHRTAAFESEAQST